MTEQVFDALVNQKMWGESGWRKLRPLPADQIFDLVYETLGHGQILKACGLLKYLKVKRLSEEASLIWESFFGDWREVDFARSHQILIKSLRLRQFSLAKLLGASELWIYEKKGDWQSKAHLRNLLQTMPLPSIGRFGSKEPEWVESLFFYEDQAVKPSSAFLLKTQWVLKHRKKIYQGCLAEVEKALIEQSSFKGLHLKEVKILLDFARGHLDFEDHAAQTASCRLLSYQLFAWLAGPMNTRETWLVSSRYVRFLCFGLQPVKISSQWLRELGHRNELGRVSAYYLKNVHRALVVIEESGEQFEFSVMRARQRPSLLTPNMVRFLKLIANHFLTEMQLGKALWNQTKRSHIQNALNVLKFRLKKINRNIDKFIEIKNGVWSQAPKSQLVIVQQDENFLQELSPVPQPKEGAVQIHNLRQSLLLNRYKPESISVGHYMKKFDVSRMTAFRDLQDLERQGLIQRFGKGRGVVYVLNDRG